jgi:hypothetical protein
MVKAHSCDRHHIASGNVGANQLLKRERGMFDGVINQTQPA